MCIDNWWQLKWNIKCEQLTKLTYERIVCKRVRHSIHANGTIEIYWVSNGRNQPKSGFQYAAVYDSLVRFVCHIKSRVLLPMYLCLCITFWERFKKIRAKFWLIQTYTELSTHTHKERPCYFISFHFEGEPIYQVTTNPNDSYQTVQCTLNMSEWMSECAANVSLCIESVDKLMIVGSINHP